MTKRTQFLEGWLASEEAALDVITVKRIYIDINDGNLHDGLMFSQIMYWHGNNKETGKPRMTITRDGELWLAKSYTDWWDECRINEHTARKSINRIAERQLTITNLWKFDGAPTVHLRVNWQEFESRVKSIWYSVSNPNDTAGQMETTPQVNSLTETTSQTTTDKIAPDGDNGPAKPKRVTPHYEHYLALLACYGFEDETVTKSVRTNYMKVAIELHTIGVPVDCVSNLYKYVAKMAQDGAWKSWSVNSLEKYAPQFMVAQKNGNGKKYNAQQQILIAEQAARHGMSVDDYIAHMEAWNK